jgi:hypothetical protein
MDADGDGGGDGGVLNPCARFGDAAYTLARLESGCRAIDIDRRDDEMLAFCRFPTNTILSCSLNEDAPQSCQELYQVDRNNVLGFENHPVSLANNGAYVLYLYETNDEEPVVSETGEALIRDGLGIVEFSTGERVVEHHLVSNSVTSGSSDIEQRLRGPRAAWFSEDGTAMFVSTHGYDEGLGRYHPGLLPVFPFSLDTGVIDPLREDMPIPLFTNGRNSGPIGDFSLDAERFVLQNSGTANPDQLPDTLIPAEVPGSSLAIINVAEGAYPTIERVIPVAEGVELVGMPELPITYDGTYAVTATNTDAATVGPTIFRVNLTTEGVDSVTLPHTGIEISSVQIAEDVNEQDLIIVIAGNESAGFVYAYDLDKLEQVGSRVHVGREIGPSDYSREQLVVAVGGACTSEGTIEERRNDLVGLDLPTVFLEETDDGTGDAGVDGGTDADLDAGPDAD